jgi:hypothetical protein
VFENRALRRKFGHKREKVAGNWRRLHNEELHNLYASPCIIGVIKLRMMTWTVHIARIKILGGKPEVNRPLGRPKHKWEDNITMDLTEIVWEVMDWIYLD